MVFCKIDYAFFNDTSKPTNLSFVAYWHVFAIAWPKQKLAKGCSSCKGVHITIEDSVVVKMLKLELSSLTFAIPYPSIGIQ
jgi:hypothetical protein